MVYAPAPTVCLYGAERRQERRHEYRTPTAHRCAVGGPLRSPTGQLGFWPPLPSKRSCPACSSCGSRSGDRPGGPGPDGHRGGCPLGRSQLLGAYGAPQAAIVRVRRCTIASAETGSCVSGLCVAADLSLLELATHAMATTYAVRRRPRGLVDCARCQVCACAACADERYLLALMSRAAG